MWSPAAVTVTVGVRNLVRRSLQWSWQRIPSSLLKLSSLSAKRSKTSSPLGCDGQLAALLYKQYDLQTSKLGQTDLVFGFGSEFISRPKSAHVGSQISSAWLWKRLNLISKITVYLFSRLNVFNIFLLSVECELLRSANLSLQDVCREK